jgi:Sec-independent protein secretion pathway component TatC
MTASQLKEKRRYCIVTAPDMLSQLSLAVPLVIAYEAAIWVTRMTDE